MRTQIWLAGAAVVMLAGGAWCAKAQSSSQQTASSQRTSSSTASTTAAPQDSLAEAARRAREQKKESPKTAKVFTNDNIPTEGGISAVGASPAPAEGGGSETIAPAGGTAKGSDKNNEKYWRDKFAALHKKLEQDQAALDVMQRELGVNEVQYYGGDPNAAVADQASMQPFGAEYNKKRDDIEAKKKEVEDDQKAIDDAEDDLHKAGGDPGWAR
jgi:cytoskeletal protein RodZ